MVDEPGHDFFPDATFAGNQDLRLGFGGAVDLFFNRTTRRADTNPLRHVVGDRKQRAPASKAEVRVLRILTAAVWADHHFLPSGVPEHPATTMPSPPQFGLSVGLDDDDGLQTVRCLRR